MRRLGPVLGLAALCAAGEVTGVVVDGKGKPVAAADVLLEVGRARYSLTADFDRWLSFDTKTARAGEDGTFSFSDVPDGATATVLASTATAVGVAVGAGKLEVRLGEPGTLKGTIAGDRKDLRDLRVWVAGVAGRGVEGKVDHKTGKYEIGGLVPGPARVHLQRGNWDVFRADVQIEAGKTATLKSKVKGDALLPCPDPIVECMQAKLVDPKGDPVRGVQLWWSSRWMDGGMNSDDDGVVKLAGGGVAIGGPPYMLRIGSLEGQAGAYGGVLKKTQRGVAIVELKPLQKVTGTVQQGEAALEKYRLLVVGPTEPLRVYMGHVEEGRYTVHVPEGRCRFVVGTLDGKTREHAFDVAPAAGPVTHEIRLE